jgi:hypothetical protein
VSADVGQNRKGAGGDHRAADRQAVEAVRQVHRVTGSDDDDGDEGHERQERQRRHPTVMPLTDHQVRPKVLQERNDQARRVQAMRLQAAQHRADQDRGQELIEQLGARGQAQVAAMDHLQIIVGKTDGAKGQRRQHGDPDEAVRQVGP